MNTIDSDNIYSVTDITKKLKNSIESDMEFSSIWVSGEIYNLTYHSSGHIYFSLKDQGAVISAVFFKFANRRLDFKLEVGMSILAFGGITLFEKRGSYQLNVNSVRLEGIGELQKRIDQLKKRLLKEGIFDDDKKKPVPFLPRRIGIVTSPTGAAFRDIHKVAVRRFPNIELILAPAKVQGEDAPITIVAGIEELNVPERGIDLIIAGRGGGSFEDLMPFNEEVVVRAFHNSRVPIISAVGHQIDHPLSDNAADLAAATPSAAAELAIPEKKDFIDEINYHMLRINNALGNRLNEYRSRIDNVTNRKIFREPFEIINFRGMQLMDVENRLVSKMKETISQKRNQLLSIPDIRSAMRNLFNRKSYEYNRAVNALEKLSPVNTLKRGYSIVLDSSEQVLRSVHDTEAGDDLTVKLHDGSINCSVKSIKEGADFG